MTVQASAVGDLHDAELESIRGVAVGPKLASAAVHYLLADRDNHAWTTAVVDGWRGVGIIVGHPDDPEVANRLKPPNCVLESTVEVEKFLGKLAR